MKTSPHAVAGTEFAQWARAFLQLCEETLALAVRESQALAGRSQYQPGEYCRLRKDLLSRIESVLVKLRGQRPVWQQALAAENAFREQTTPMLQCIQTLLMRILVLDRENQQALLRCGLAPAAQLATAQPQPPGFVASLYRRNSRS